jgi:predicted HTH transcriptional regulator
VVIESAAMASDVEKLIQKFAADLQALIRSDLSDEVNGAVRAALGSGGRAAGKSTKAAPGRPSTGKRTPEQIEKQAEKILAYVAKNPEQRAEQIAKAVGLTTKELVGPIKKLLAEKKVKASGVARGTNYKAVG